MKVIAGYLRDYARYLPLPVLAATGLLMGVLIGVNYTLGIESHIIALPLWARFAGFFCLYGFVFGSAWLLHFGLLRRLTAPPPRFFYVLLVVGPLLFAGKTFADPIATWLADHVAAWPLYASRVLLWPIKALLVIVPVVLLWRWGRYESPVAGLYGKRLQWWPYFLLLLFMLPLIAFAATQADFLHTYPKVKRVAFIDAYTALTWPWKLLYELSYGLDFLTIEFFFRGFLVLAFVRFAGRDAILPMAAFYCSIHFGKPLFECITSFFGGLILGAIVYHTRDIRGGLIVHLGIAWLMELAGWVGNAV